MFSGGKYAAYKGVCVKRRANPTKKRLAGTALTQRAIEVLDQVVGVFEADGQAQ
jgi:hypothetical protein